MKGLRTRLLVFGLPLLEVATAYLVGRWIGFGWMLLLLLAGIPVGFAVMRNAGDAAMRDVTRSAQTGGSVDGGRHALTFVGGLLIAIPGFWTDLLGLVLVVPLTQWLLRRPARAWLEGRMTTVRVPGMRYPGDVVQGTVIIQEDPPPGAGPARPPGGPALPPGGPGA